MFCHPTVWCHYSSCSTLTVIFELTLCKMNNYFIVPFINLHVQTYFQFEAVVSRIFLWNHHTKNSLKDFYVFLGFISVAIKYDDLYQWKTKKQQGAEWQLWYQDLLVKPKEEQRLMCLFFFFFAFVWRQMPCLCRGSKKNRSCVS